MGRVFLGRVSYGPSLSWVELVMGRVVQLPLKGGAPKNQRRNTSNPLRDEMTKIKKIVAVNRSQNFISGTEL